MADDGFKIKPWLRIVSSILLGLFLYSIASYLVHDAWTDTVQGRVFTSDKSSDTVVARAWVERPSSALNGQFRCWISLENLTGKPVGQVQFVAVRRFHSEKNKPTDIDEVEKRVNLDLAQAFKGRPGAAVRALAAGDRQTFWTAFQAPEAEGEYEILLIFEWIQDGKLAQNSLLVGPREVFGMKSRLLRAGNSLYVIWKDLALPVVLVALTFLLSQWREYAEDRRKREERVAGDARRRAEEVTEAWKNREEKKREQVRLEAERQKEQVRETLARMLAISHNDAKRFYLPILSAVRELSDKIERRDRADWQDQTFYWAMMFLSIMKRLKEKNGGFYLKTRTGEDVLSDIWFVLKRAFQRTFGEQDYDSALEEMGDQESYASFRKISIIEGTALESCRTAFLDWAKGPVGFGEIYAPLFRIFYYVLGYEANLPYLYWYGEPDRPPNSKLKRIENAVLKGPLGEQLRANKISTTLKTYRRKSFCNYRDVRRTLGVIQPRVARPRKPTLPD